ncbi:MAG: Ig-like domain-containing protein [Lachnospiraceae bacterium]|nr:Ig-like domain-containing protein [Lachnospiraceae bacterium]
MKRRLIASVMAAMFVVASVPGQTISALAGEQASVEETYAAGSEGGQADQTQAVAAETASPDNTSEASATGVATQVAGDDVSDAMTPELTASDTGVEASLIEDQDSQPSEVVPDDVLSADQSSEGEMPEDGIIEEGSDSAAGDSGLISEDGQEAVSGNMVEERAPEAETKLGEDELINLVLNQSVETILESGDTRVFTFTPSETGAYRFHSVGATKDSGINVSISNDLSGTDTIGYWTTDSSTGESQAEGVLRAGTKYYLCAYYYKDNGASLTVAFQLDQDNKFLATAEHQNVRVPVGQQAELKVNVSGESTDVTYQWYGPGHIVIQNESGSEYHATEVGDYGCLVTSNKEVCYVTFHVSIDNEFEATVKGSEQNNRRVVVAPGANATLGVEATAIKEGFTYQWYQTDGQNTLIKDANSDTYIAENVSKEASYQCDVTDFFGNRESVYFNVDVDNKLQVTVKGSEDSSADIEVDPNGSATLEVAADAIVSGFTYKWCQIDGDKNILIPDADSNRYIVSNIMKTASYRCDVSDLFGNTEPVNFNVTVKHELYVLNDEGEKVDYYSKRISILQNSSVVLQIPKVVGATKYEWSKKEYSEDEYSEDEGEYQEIPGSANKTSITVNESDLSQAQTIFRCTVSDEYDNQIELSYYIDKSDKLFIRTDTPYDQYSFQQGEAASIGVTAISPDSDTPIEFSWSQADNEAGPYVPLDSPSSTAMPDKENHEATASLTISDMRKIGDRYYRCTAKQGNVTDSVDIWVCINPTLHAWAENSLFVGEAGSKVSLKVAAESTAGDLTYSWYKVNTDGVRSGVLAHDAALDVILSSEIESYICVVADMNGEKEISFATVGSSATSVEYGNAYKRKKAADISCGSPLLVKWPDSSDSTSAIYLKFIPAIDGVYTIKSEGDADTVLDLLRADGTLIEEADDNDNGNLNFYLKRSLEKNSTYYIKISTYGGGEAESLVSVVCDHTHTWRKLSEKPATCTEAGEKTEICDCGEERTTSIQALGHVEEKIPAVAATCTKTGLTEGTKCSRCGVILRAQQSTPVLGHSYGAWVQVKAPTALEEGYRERTCTRCGAKDSGRQMIAKLPATMTLNATSIPLQVKKSTTKLTVSGLAAGDSVASVASSNTKIVKASWNGRVLKITAQKKTGKAKVTIALRSGLSRTVTVKVQKPKVVSRKITGVPSKLTLKKGQKYKLTPSIQPITAPDKIKYSSSNKKTAKVSSKGLITAGKKPGKATITISAGGKKFKVKVTVPKK